MLRLILVTMALGAALLLSGYRLPCLPGQVSGKAPVAKVPPAIVDARFAHLPEEAEESYAMLVMVEGQLYRCTGEEMDIDGRCGTMDGEILQSVERGDLPFMDGQSNFGAPYGYQYSDDGQIEVCIDGRWLLFRPVEAGEEEKA